MARDSCGALHSEVALTIRPQNRHPAFAEPAKSAAAKVECAALDQPEELIPHILQLAFVFFIADN